MVKSLRVQCIEMLTEIEARIDFDDEMPPLDPNLIMGNIQAMSRVVENALETANYDKLLQSGLQVPSGLIYIHVYTNKILMKKLHSPIAMLHHYSSMRLFWI